MSDDLVQRLRKGDDLGPRWPGHFPWPLLLEAADCIEALESEIDIALVTIKRISDERTAALHLIESLQELLEFYAPIKSTSSC